MVMKQVISFVAFSSALATYADSRGIASDCGSWIQGRTLPTHGTEAADDGVPFEHSANGDQRGFGVRFVNAIHQYNGRAYFGGYFFNVFGTPATAFASWDGLSWSAPGGMAPGSCVDCGPYVRSMTTYSGLLIAAGNFSIPGLPGGKGIAAWNGSSWSSLGSGVAYSGFDSDEFITAMAVYNNELYVAGPFYSIGGVSGALVRWNGAFWQTVTSGVSGWQISAMTVYKNELIVAGSFTSFDNLTANCIARWDGNTWNTLGDGLNGPVSALAVFDDDLIVGGSFTSAGGVAGRFRIARWDGANWHSMGLGMNGSVSELVEYNGRLHAGGSFTTADGNNINRIACWNGSAWNPLGNGLGQTVRSSCVFDGELLVCTGTALDDPTIWSRFYRWREEIQITSIPQNQTECPGGVATFQGDAAAPGGVTYRWRKNGIDLVDGGRISGAETNTLTINPVVVGDEGAYDVVFTSDCGSIDANDVSLTIPPIINAQPVATVSCVGGKASMSCDVSGSGSVEYQWRKDGTPLSDGGTISGTNTATLTINGAVPGDSAAYDVLITDDCRTIVSDEAAFSVRSGPLILQHPASIVRCAPNTVVLNVGAETMAGASYQWRRNGNNLSNGGHYSGVNSATLVISNPTPSESDTYDVLITDDCGPSISNPAIVTVISSTQVTSPPSLVSACENELISITAEVFGAPPITYQWRRLGVNLANSPPFSGVNTPTLTINPFTSSQADTYDCVIHDECGTSFTTSTSLVVTEGPPSLIFGPTGQDLCEGQPLSLGAFATSSPSPTYQWRLDGQPIVNATGSTYDVLYASPANTGLYDVVIVNGCFSLITDPVAVNVFSSATADGNTDGAANGLDVPGLIDALLNWDGVTYTAPYCAYDVNADAYVDQSDIPGVVAVMLGQ